jgi:hypothetical protein
MLSYDIKVLVFSTLCAFVKYACSFEFGVSIAAIRPSIHCGWNLTMISDLLDIKWCILFPHIRSKLIAGLEIARCY